MREKDWKRALIRPDTKTFEAMKIIDASAMQIALVVDDQSRLVGVVTDGDIRRALLKGLSLEEPVHLIMNRNFTTADQQTSAEEILGLMRRKSLHHIPLVDSQGRVVGLKVLDAMIQPPRLDNWVVLMAGGQGNRLRPLTEETPKPMLQVGNKPMLEIILENFVDQRFHKFFMALHYKAEMIEANFGDGSRWDVSIQYLREEQPLGTAGALGLLPDRPTLPTIVMNGDLLTKVNFHHLLNFHQTYQAVASMCVRDFHFQVPYGVIGVDQHRLVHIDEKPVQHFFVNAGIYVLEPQVFDMVPKGRYLDMPTLFNNLVQDGLKTVAFPIREYWMDIGRLDDFKRANGEFQEYFA
jgi:dTDP-glucose pyrophosphorylase